MSTKIPQKGVFEPLTGNPKSNHSSNSPKHSTKLPSKSTKAKVTVVPLGNGNEGDTGSFSPSPSSKAHHRTSNNSSNIANMSHKKTNNATTSSSHPSPENSRKEHSPIRSDKSSPVGSKSKLKMKSHRSDKVVNSNHYIPTEEGRKARSCWGMLLISMGIRKETVHLRTAYAKEAAQALNLEQWHLQKVKKDDILYFIL